MEAHPDAYLKEIAEVFGCHPSSALRRLTMLDITQKPPPKKKNQVEAYLEEKLKTFPKKSSYIIDDTCIQMQMYRHVRAVNGENERIFASVASGIAELGLLRRYVRENRSIDSFQYVGAMNGVLFDRRFEKTLLKNLPKKRIIIMDNAAFHPKELLV